MATKQLAAQYRLDLFLHFFETLIWLLFCVKRNFMIEFSLLLLVLTLLIFVVVEAPEVLSCYWVAIISDRGLDFSVP